MPGRAKLQRMPESMLHLIRRIMREKKIDSGVKAQEEIVKELEERIIKRRRR